MFLFPFISFKERVYSNFKFTVARTPERNQAADEKPSDQLIVSHFKEMSLTHILDSSFSYSIDDRRAPN